MPSTWGRRHGQPGFDKFRTGLVKQWTQVTKELQRMLELMEWMRGIGVHNLCALRIAICAVEKEFGNKGAIVGKCMHATSRRPTCDDMARAKWAERPRHLISDGKRG